MFPKNNLRCHHLSLLVFSIFLFGACKNSSDESANQNGNVLFSLLKPDQTNIDFQNTLTEAPNTNILMYEYFYNGAGVAAGDFNNDGLIDLYFSSNMSDNKFYLNKGKMLFQDVTEMSGAGGRSGPWKTGVNTVDINSDGKLDIYLCYSGALPAQKRVNQLFINIGNDEQGIPHFEERAARKAMRRLEPATSTRPQPLKTIRRKRRLNFFKLL